MTNVVAVVVTYNRIELLMECLDSLLNQTYSVKNIILINNNSTDNTEEKLTEKGYLKDARIIYKKLPENIGGSGGFHEGMKIAREQDCDWVWIMDDDTIPKKDCLEELLIKSNDINGKISYLASAVEGPNGEPMNVPKVDVTPSQNGYADWYKHLENGIIKITEATFVSILINHEAIERCGLPVKDYFIWGDDTEYTLRITRFFGNAYLVGNSKVIHKRKGGKSLSLIEEDNSNRIKLYYYMVRNNYINTKEYSSSKELIKYVLRNVIMIFKIIFSNSKYKLKKVQVINRGLFAAIFKRYDYKSFTNRFVV